MKLIYNIKQFDFSQINSLCLCALVYNYKKSLCLRAFVFKS
jgi:hypothetical protein